MPYSGTFMDNFYTQLLRNRSSEINTVLDIGVGAGKYAALTKQVLPQAQLYGIEPVADYHRRFSEVYRQYESVWTRAADTLFNDPDATWDLVVLGDVIEHMRKSAGLDLLHFLVYRTKYIYAQFPTRYIQNPADVDGEFHEAHISVWDTNDFAQFDFVHFYQVPLNVVVVDGYLTHTLVNEGYEIW